MTVASPWFLVLLPILFIALLLRLKKYRPASILFPMVSQVAPLQHPRTQVLSRVVFVLRICALIALIIALARPQTLDLDRSRHTEGIDIVLALDVSQSMRAEDFKPQHRLAVAKKHIMSFVSQRRHDRIGLVVFGGDAFTQSPLTVDHDMVRRVIGGAEIGMAGDGTAIGMAIATGINRLKHSDARSKIIVLLTDGENNRGEIDPISAAELARSMGIKIYVIGVGKDGGALIPIDDPVFGRSYARNPNGSLVKTKIDEGALTQIATITDGAYFRATDASALSDIYTQIDRLETSKISTTVSEHAKDLFPLFLWIGLICLVLEILLSSLFLVKVP